MTTDNLHYIGFIYFWENTHPDAIKHKFYIGQHIGRTDDGYIGSGVIFIKRFYCKKYRGHWRRTILEHCNTVDELNAAEIKHIATHNATTDQSYCNVRNGEKNGKHSHTTRNKISLACKGRSPWNKGLTGLPKQTNETKAKRLESRKLFYSPIFQKREEHIIKIIKDTGSIKVVELATHDSFTLRIAANTIRHLVNQHKIKKN